MTSKGHQLMTAIRTMLFVPGDRPDRIVKAVASDADCTMVDLEDAVAASAKDHGRAGAANGIAAAARDRGRIGVRVNALASGLLGDDLIALTPIWPLLNFVMLPMVPDADTVREVAALLARVDKNAAVDVGPRLIPLIETAQGVLAAPAIAAAQPRLFTLAFGPADLSNQLGITLTPAGTELLHARSQLVLAAAAAGLVPPIDGPWLDLRDTTGLRRSATAARDLGFSGKQVLHPSQIGPVRDAFAVTPDQLAWARAVDRAFADAESQGVSSIQLPDGTFVDYPVARRARALLDRS
jgi:citrate lyase subunit beta / citryl-CoA lyase